VQFFFVSFKVRSYPRAPLPRMTTLFVPGPKCPDAQTARNDHCNPGYPHWYVETSNMHRPLVQSPHGLNHRYHAEDNT